MAKRQMSKRKKVQLAARDLKREKVRCLAQALAIAVVAVVLAGVPYFAQPFETLSLEPSIAMGISTCAMFLGAMLASTRMQAFMRAKKDLEAFCEAHSLRKADIR